MSNEKRFRALMRPIACAFAATLFATGIAACEDEDPVEEAVEETADEIDDATDVE